MNPKLFHLQRDRDVSGVSGTGRVANGVLWPDGTVAVRWVGDRPSTVHWDRIADAEAVHGHGGATRLVWAEAQQPVTLSPAERTMLDYALDQAQERIWSDDGFTDEDQAAVDSLRRLTADQPAAGADRG
ncbi:hypothetical protein [Streptomyces olivaceus]|uniref:hypothetical protein n=1 Tax=Streptomyces olivaceus TaxID=47716 RepID=UPI0022EE2BD1|nr:hypothetical protein [Streptomyces olivaceus]GHI91304.1 hypothetical protein TPA0905_07750 [Streptomyces olivaceus]